MHTLLLLLALSGFGADAYATNRNFENGRPAETNPIARPFMTHGTAVRGVYFAAGAGTFLYVDHRLSRRHKIWARVFDVAVIGSEAYFIAYSVRNYGARQ